MALLKSFFLNSSLPSSLKSSADTKMNEGKRHLAFSYVKVKKLSVVKVMLVQSFLRLRNILSHYKHRKLFQSPFLSVGNVRQFYWFSSGLC